MYFVGLVCNQFFKPRVERDSCCMHIFSDFTLEANCQLSSSPGMHVEKGWGGEVSQLDPVETTPADEHR
jgi:hypothetical protein